MIRQIGHKRPCGQEEQWVLVGGGMVILKKWREATAVEEEKVQKRPRGLWFECLAEVGRSLTVEGVSQVAV